MGRLITPRRVLRDYAISLVLWLAMAVLVAGQESRLAALEHMHWTFHDMVILFGIRYFTIALLTPPIFYIVERWPLGAGRLAKRIVAYTGGYVLFSVTFAVIRWTLYSPWSPQTQTWAARNTDTLLQVTYDMFADIFGIYLAILLAAHAYAYFVNMQRQEREQFELKQALTQSQLQVLRNQMQPHFLFNTLHGIATLVSSDPECARTMIVNLSNLLRRSARHGDADLVSLEDDLQFATEYLSIEKMRLGERLEVRWDIAPETRQMLVPQFLLQPLLENAIKHGIAPSPHGGWMEMTSTQQRDTLRLRVRNSAASEVQRHNGGGVGLSNMRARLRCLYGNDAELRFGVEHGIATTSLVLPRLSAPSKSGPRARQDEPK